MSSINSPPAREKFRLVSTVAFILQERLKSLRGIEFASWLIFCAALFGINFAELEWDYDSYKLLKRVIERTKGNYISAMYGHFAETKKLVPEPILSHRIANVAISCMQYLLRWDSIILPIQNRFPARRATKFKLSPWLWRRRMRVTSMRRRPPIWDLNRNKYLFFQNLRRDHRTFYSENLQEQRIFCTWTLDLLYHTLRKAMESSMLTRTLLKPFIPSLATLLFPRRVKRVRKAAAAYLEKVSRKASLRIPDDDLLH